MKEQHHTENLRKSQQEYALLFQLNSSSENGQTASERAPPGAHTIHHSTKRPVSCYTVESKRNTEADACKMTQVNLSELRLDLTLGIEGLFAG